MTVRDLFTGFGVNLLVALLIVRFIYYPARQDKNYVFTFLAFSTIIYFVMSFLATAELGWALGSVCSPSSPSCAIARSRWRRAR